MIPKVVLSVNAHHPLYFARLFAETKGLSARFSGS
jgi:hypothetical protein